MGLTGAKVGRNFEMTKFLHTEITEGLARRPEGESQTTERDVTNTNSTNSTNIKGHTERAERGVTNTNRTNNTNNKGLAETAESAEIF